MADGAYTFELCDQVDVVLADVSGLVTSTVSPRLNRPFSLVAQAPADQEEWKTIHTDGDRYLTEGVRTIKVTRDGVLVANAEIWRLDYSADENSQQVQISCFDPGQRLPARLVRDSVGEVSSWKFADPISAGDLVQQLLQNSVTFDDAPIAADHPPSSPPRLFPIDYTSGDFTAASDVSDELTDGPSYLGDLIYTKICDTGVADFVLAPTDTAAGSPPGIYAIAHCVDAWGSDKTGSVHFDYQPGSNGNVKALRRSFDMSLVANWLRYLLGPKLSPDHWRGSVDGIDPAVFGAGYPYLDAQYVSQQKYGTLAVWDVYDSDANTVRALYEVLWKTESTLRVNPRQLVYLTPAANCTSEPFADYGIGDLVAVNLGDDVGPAVTGDVQRVYGFDLTVDVNGVESPGELIVSPDGAAV